jgi:hypothetical protein
MAMFTFDPVQDSYGERRDPDLFLANHPPPIILDEVQYVPELVAAVKRYVDRHRKPGSFVLTGSHQWQVMRNLAESLAGRAAILELGGFTLAETHEEPRLAWFPAWLKSVSGRGDAAAAERLLRQGTAWEYAPAEAIWRGSYPEPTALPREAVPGWMRGYVATYVQRDVRLQLAVRDEAQFGRFMALCATLTAQEVNTRQLGRDIGASAPTARAWLDALRGGGQWIELPAYTGNLTQRMSRAPKGHLADTGLACHLLRLPDPASISGHPAFGALFETWVVNDLIRQCVQLDTEPVFHHFRRHSGLEIDLIAEYGGRIYPLEIKASSRARPVDADAIGRFQRDLGDRAGEGLVIYAGREYLKLGDRAFAVPMGWRV